MSEGSVNIVDIDLVIGSRLDSRSIVVETHSSAGRVALRLSAGAAASLTRALNTALRAGGDAGLPSFLACDSELALQAPGAPSRLRSILRAARRCSLGISIAVSIAICAAADAARARDQDKTVLQTGRSVVADRPRPALAAPSPLRASTASAKVRLSWSDVQKETGFVIERRRHGTKRFAEIAKTPSDITSYTDTLTDGAHYAYRVRAYSASRGLRYSAYSNLAYSTVACD